MSDASHSRRQVLKIIIGGVATAIVLPSKWTKPLVSSMVVPAHAQASPPPTTTSTTTSTTSSTTTTSTTSSTTTKKPYHY